jgi:hypothetical protein
MIRVDPPKVEAADTSEWTDADWNRAMLETAMQIEAEKQSGFIKDPDYVPNTNGCTHPAHNIRGIVVIPRGKLYRHVCPGCKETSYWKPY